MIKAPTKLYAELLAFPDRNLEEGREYFRHAVALIEDHDYSEVKNLVALLSDEQWANKRFFDYFSGEIFYFVELLLSREEWELTQQLMDKFTFYQQETVLTQLAKNLFNDPDRSAELMNEYLERHPEAITSNGQIALMRSAHPKLTGTLLKHGADPNVTDQEVSRKNQSLFEYFMKTKGAEQAEVLVDDPRFIGFLGHSHPQEMLIYYSFDPNFEMYVPSEAAALNRLMCRALSECLEKEEDPDILDAAIGGFWLTATRKLMSSSSENNIMMAPLITAFFEASQIVKGLDLHNVNAAIKEMPAFVEGRRQYLINTMKREEKSLASTISLQEVRQVHPNRRTGPRKV